MNGLSSRNNAAERTADEESPLLGRPGKPSDSRVWTRLQRHMTADVSKHWADLVLLFCYIITGLLDSSSTSIWGSFVSMQTGNTVYLGLGITQPTAGIRWIKAAISISSFCLGSFFFSRFHRYFMSRRRWVLVASYALQLSLIAFAAAIVTFFDHSTEDNVPDGMLHWQVAVPLAAVAFQSAGQAVTSRVLQYGGLTSVVLTSNYCDLFSDQNLFALKNVERNRRVAAPLLLLLGAIFGGLWSRHPFGIAGALWTAVVLKGLVVGAWVLWGADLGVE